MLRECEKTILAGVQCQSYLRYARCVLWASDPEVLKKFFLQDGKFTLDKLLQKSTYAPGNFKKLDLPIADQLLPSLMAEVKDAALYCTPKSWTTIRSFCFWIRTCASFRVSLDF